MYADIYLAEHIIRDRLAEARKRAELVRLLGPQYRRFPRANAIGHRLLEIGRSLLKKGGRRAVGTRPPLEGGTLDELHGQTTTL